MPSTSGAYAVAPGHGVPTSAMEYLNSYASMLERSRFFFGALPTRPQGPLGTAIELNLLHAAAAAAAASATRERAEAQATPSSPSSTNSSNNINLTTVTANPNPLDLSVKTIRQTPDSTADDDVVVLEHRRVAAAAAAAAVAMQPKMNMYTNGNNSGHQHFRIGDTLVPMSLMAAAAAADRDMRLLPPHLNAFRGSSITPEAFLAHQMAAAAAAANHHPQPHPHATMLPSFPSMHASSCNGAICVDPHRCRMAALQGHQNPMAPRPGDLSHLQQTGHFPNTLAAFYDRSKLGPSGHHQGHHQMTRITPEGYVISEHDLVKGFAERYHYHHMMGVPKDSAAAALCPCCPPKPFAVPCPCCIPGARNSCNGYATAAAVADATAAAAAAAYGMCCPTGENFGSVFPPTSSNNSVGTTSSKSQHKPKPAESSYKGAPQSCKDTSASSSIDCKPSSKLGKNSSNSFSPTTPVSTPSSAPSSTTSIITSSKTVSKSQVTRLPVCSSSTSPATSSAPNGYVHTSTDKSDIGIKAEQGQRIKSPLNGGNPMKGPRITPDKKLIVGCSSGSPSLSPPAGDPTKPVRIFAPLVHIPSTTSGPSSCDAALPQQTLQPSVHSEASRKPGVVSDSSPSSSSTATTSTPSSTALSLGRASAFHPVVVDRPSIIQVPPGLKHQHRGHQHHNLHQQQQHHPWSLLMTNGHSPPVVDKARDPQVQGPVKRTPPLRQPAVSSEDRPDVPDATKACALSPSSVPIAEPSKPAVQVPHQPWIETNRRNPEVDTKAVRCSDESNYFVPKKRLSVEAMLHDSSHQILRNHLTQEIHQQRHHQHLLALAPPQLNLKHEPQHEVDAVDKRQFSLQQVNKLLCGTLDVRQLKEVVAEVSEKSLKRKLGDDNSDSDCDVRGKLSKNRLVQVKPEQLERTNVVCSSSNYSQDPKDSFPSSEMKIPQLQDDHLKAPVSDCKDHLDKPNQVFTQSLLSSNLPADSVNGVNSMPHVGVKLVKTKSKEGSEYRSVLSGPDQLVLRVFYGRKPFGPSSQGVGVNVPGGAYRLGVRRKFRSGFDYLRQKKKCAKKFNGTILKPPFKALNGVTEVVTASENLNARHVLWQLKKNRYGHHVQSSHSDSEAIKEEDGIQDLKKECEDIANMGTKNPNVIRGEIKRLMTNKALGETVLHKAARMGHEEVVSDCLQSEAVPIDCQDNAGYTPLHECCSRGHLNIARSLLEYGADVNASAAGGVRPIHDAVENDHVEVVRLLLSYGADPLIATYAGLTPTKLARSQCMKDFLKGYLADVTGDYCDQTVLPWQFHGSCSLLDPWPTGFNVFDRVPDEDAASYDGPYSEDLDSDLVFEVSDKPHIPMFRLRTLPNCCHGPSDFCLLRDILDETGLDRHELEIHHQDVEVTAVTVDNLKGWLSSSVCPSTSSNTTATSSTASTNLAKLLHLLSASPSTSTVDIVRVDDTIRAMLGIERVAIPLGED